MPMIDRDAAGLLIIDVQTRLMPAIHEGAMVIANVRRLMTAARMLAIPVAFTEQNPAGLGPTVAELGPASGEVIVSKMSFDACREGGLARLPDRPSLVVAGCEAHVCVLQTALGLLEAGYRVFVVQDAIGARRVDSKTAAMDRMRLHGAEMVTTEMVVFEWASTAAHPRFRELVALIK